MTGKLWTVIGSISAAVSVGMGAFAAHDLKERLNPEMLEIFETAARYQMYHALALLAVGLLTLRAATTALQLAGWAFLIGTLLFCGSLYALSLTGQSGLGKITPFGGVSFLIGWISLVVGAWRMKL